MIYYNRRGFLKASALLTAATAIVPNNLLAAARSAEVLGLQLYTVRDAMRVDPKATLQKVSKAGYYYVEHAGYNNGKFYGYAPKEFKKMLLGFSLKMMSGHNTMTARDWDEGKKDFTDKWKQTIADCAEAGQRYVISPAIDDNLHHDAEGLKRFMDQFNNCGELCKKSGMKFGYHNHEFEFDTMVDGMKIYDFILKNTDGNLVAQQMDIGNMYTTGGMAIDYLKKYPGRFELMHVKDQLKKADGKFENTTLGNGVLPVKDILAVATKAGTRVFFVEQEEYQGLNPIACSKTDHDAMVNWGY